VTTSRESCSTLYESRRRDLMRGSFVDDLSRELLGALRAETADIRCRAGTQCARRESCSALHESRPNDSAVSQHLWR